MMKRSISRILAAAMLCTCLLGCGTAEETTMADAGIQSQEDPAGVQESQAGSGAADGTYTASTQGHNGPVTVSVVIEDGKVADMTLEESSETLTIGTAAFEIVRDTLVNRQSLQVDAIAGATISRAAFVYAAKQALTEAGADVAAMEAEAQEEAPESVTMQTELLVVGSGIAGVSASLAGAEAGMEVLLLEKNGILGGTSAKSEGIVTASGTQLQQDAGIEDDPETMAQDMKKLFTSAQINGDLITMMAENANDNLNWLADQGVEFYGVYAVHFYAPRSTGRGHLATGKGAQLMDTLIGKMKESEAITIHTDTCVTELIVEDGAVVGAKATNRKGDDITIEADNVILCTGGYSANAEMIEQLSPNMGYYTTQSLCTGDGYQMAQAAGANMLDTPDTLTFLTYQLPTTTRVTTSALGFENPDLLLVLPDGTRYGDEGRYCFDRAGDVFAAGYSYEYAIVDEDYFSVMQEEIEAGYDCGYAFQGENAEELAAAIGMDSQILTQTISDYNEMCQAGEDTQFQKPAEYLNPLEGTLYALKLTSCCTETYGGPELNENGQVIDTAGEPIPGLYAAGAISMVQTGDYHYLGSGTALLTGVTFARQAVAHMAQK